MSKVIRVCLDFTPSSCMQRKGKSSLVLQHLQDFSFKLQTWNASRMSIENFQSVELNNVPNLKSQNSTVSVKDKKKLKLGFRMIGKITENKKTKLRRPNRSIAELVTVPSRFPVLEALTLSSFCLFVFFSSSHFSTLTSHRLFGLFSLCWDWLVLRHQSQFTPSLNRSCHN